MEKVFENIQNLGAGGGTSPDAPTTPELQAAELISYISEKNVFQAKSLDGLLDKLSQEEKEGLESLIGYYVKQGDTVEHLADCYLKFIQDIMEEQYYFIRNKRYRYSSAGEVNSFFYQNPGYMEYYMKGLAISTYLLESHRKCRQWYSDKIQTLNPGRDWLDVGVGHGEYFVLAAHHTVYERYLGIDISPTCVEMCREMAGRRIPAGEKHIAVRVQDFFAYDGPTCDAVVLGEILEHVEKPERFLEKVREITHEDSFIYIATVTNCPQKDHIYLFKSVEEIETMYRQCGFDILDRLVCPTNGYPLEKATKLHTAIMTAHVLKKR